MASTFGETIREMRQAQQMGLRTAADRLGISPAYLSRFTRSGFGGRSLPRSMRLR